MLGDEDADEYNEEEGEEGEGEEMELDENQQYEQDEHHDYEGAEEEEEEGSHETEEQRPLGRFMSPQIPRSTRQPRLSLGVGVIPDDGPRRVRVVAPWKVNEIEVPAPVKEEDSNALSRSSLAPPSTPRSPVKREKLTEEEREVSVLARIWRPTLTCFGRLSAHADDPRSQRPTTSSRAKPRAPDARSSRPSPLCPLRTSRSRANPPRRPPKVRRRRRRLRLRRPQRS